MSTPIKTSRLLLRPLRLTDAQSIFEIRRIDAVHVNFLTLPWTSPHEATIWINEIFDNNGLIYTISLLPNPEKPPEDCSVIGLIGLSRWDTITYLLHPSHWNHGYCTEALHSFLPEVWKREPQRMFVDASIMEGNEASKRVLEKCGFKQPNLERLRRLPTSKPPVAFRERGEDGRGEEDETSIEVEDIVVDIYGNRRLSNTEFDELRSAIEALNVQSKPTIEPVRAPPEDGVTPRPMKKNKLVGYRYERKFDTDELLDVLDNGEYF